MRAGGALLVKTVTAAALLALPVSPARPQPSEAAVKAAFLPKFARYVSWPAAARPRPGQPWQLCLVGRDPFGPMIDRAAAGERIDGRPVVVRRMAGPEGAAGCHVAYAHGIDADSTARLLRGLHRRHILTVTDFRAGPHRGMIHFVLADGRVRFYIDEAEAASENLSISSRLLALAIGVRQRRG